MTPRSDQSTHFRPGSRRRRIPRKWQGLAVLGAVAAVAGCAAVAPAAIGVAGSAMTVAQQVGTATTAVTTARSAVSAAMAAIDAASAARAAASAASAPAAPATPASGSTVDASAGDAALQALPSWLQARLRQDQAQAHRSVVSVDTWRYQGRPVYELRASCCDRFNELYDARGQYLCAPSGGYTGQGDGKCPDAAAARRQPGARPQRVWPDADVAAEDDAAPPASASASASVPRSSASAPSPAAATGPASAP